MTDNVVQQNTSTTPRPSSIATSVSVSISDRMSGVSADSSSALSSARNSVATSGTPTTTISTIAMQSGQTKIVIALLQSREWLQLKVLNMDPHITQLGTTLKESAEMLASHEDVLKKLQSKQSPVEELLRQADQLISTQKPRAEVYAAMAESLGLAWKDLNNQLEQRKTILKFNTSLHTELEECSAKIIQVENASCEDPETIEACQELISRSKLLRKSMLSSFLRCLEEGQSLIEKLEEQRTIDSRPEYGAIQAQFSISQVQRWLEKLHDRRGILEERFRTKQDKLSEQIKFLGLQKGLKQIRREIQEHRAFNTNYGSDVTSVNDLITDLDSRVLKIQELRDKTLQVANTVDKIKFRHFGESSLKNESFEIIDDCNQIISHAEEMRYKLKLCLEFFQLVSEAQDKLDKLGPEEPELIKRLDEITITPLNKGQLLLNNLGWDNPNSNGVRVAYDELLGRKNQVVQAEDVMYKTSILNEFLQNFNKLYSYLIDVDSSLKAEQNLGPELSSAEALRDTLRSKLAEIESKQVVFDLDEEIRSDDLEEKVSSLNQFMKELIESTERRLALTEYYLELRKQASIIEHELLQEEQESGQRKTQGPKPKVAGPSETPFQQKLIKLDDLSAGFLQACKEAGKLDSAFGTEQACLKIKEILSNIHRRLDKAAVAKKQATEEMIRQISKTMDSCADLIKSAYPVLPEESPQSPPLPPTQEYKGSLTDGVLTHIESTLNHVLSQVGQLELDLEALLENDPENEEVLKSELNQLKAFAINYKLLSLNFTTFFKNLREVDVLIEDETERNPMATESTAYEEADEILKICREHAGEIVMNIREIEPEDSGKLDEARLLAAIEEKRLEWDEAMRRKAKAIAARDLQQIERQLADLKKHLEITRGQYGESLLAARECSTSFSAFEETIDILGAKIDKFIQHVDEDMKGKAATLRENWVSFLQMTRERRRLIDLSLQYFTLVNEAETWFKDGSKLLITIARKSASVKNPQEADELLGELESFVKPGEVKQDERIAKISQLASQLYGEEKRRLYDAMMVKENREMLDSLNSMNNELSVLAENLRSKHANVAEEPIILTIVEPVNEASIVERISTSPVKAVPTESPMATSSTSTSTITETVVTTLNTIETSILRPITPTMMEKETQFEILPSHAPEKRERDTVTQTVDEKQFEKETQTDVEMKPVVVIPPSFTSPLKDIAINEGEKIRFQCIVTGRPEPTITWLKDGLLVTSSNLDYKTEFKNGICSLTIDETFAEDSSIFTCRAASEAGTAETSAKLVVKESQDRMLSPPRFEMPLAPSTTLIEGTVNHQLSCLVKGNPLPTVEWFKDNVNIDTSSEFIITFNNGLCILKFDEVILEDAGIYTCKATNKAGEAESKSELLVEARSIAFLEPLSKKTMARTGHKLKLECRTNTPCEFQWFHDGKPVKDNIKSDPTSSTLMITEAFAKDAGHYVVIATNPRLGENKCSCHVVVKGRLPNETSDSEFHSDMEPTRPKVKMGLQDTQVNEGERVVLDCVITGQPEPEVIWYHEDQPIKESKDFQLQFHGDKCSLIIKEAFQEDAGNYRVTAINSAGEANSSCKLNVSGPQEKEAKRKEASPGVLVPPKFSKLIEDTMVNENDEVTLKCSISEGQPPPTIKWYKNAVEITDKPGYVISKFGDDHELKILKALPEHRGNYMVKASNSVGETKCFGCLIVKAPLESPTSLRKAEDLFPPPIVSSSQTDVVETTVQTSIVTAQLSLQRGNSDDVEPVSVQDRAAFFKSKDLSSKGTSANLPLIIKPRSYAAPRFISPLTSVMADDGALVVLEGQIDGYPDPTIKWTRNDLDFAFEPHSKFAHGKVTLELRDVQISDGGRYACIAENDAGIATSIADVIVKKKTFPPVFGKRLQAQTVQRNKRIYMEVEVIGTPSPTVVWFKDAIPLDVRHPDYQFRSEGNRHILIIPSATIDKSGQYMVKASNEAGNAQSIADVVVLDDRRRSPAAGVTIFESTIGVTEEKPVTIIYETRSIASPPPEKSHLTPRDTIRSPKNVPIILKTQPTLPSAESYDVEPIPRPVLESPRLMSPLGKPLQPVAVKVESITVTSEPAKDKKKSYSSSTEISTSAGARKVVQETTSEYHQKSTSVYKSAPNTAAKVHAIPIIQEKVAEGATSTATTIAGTATSSASIAIDSDFFKSALKSDSSSKLKETSITPPPPPPPPQSTPEPPIKPSTNQVSGNLPETILKFMESIPPATPQSQLSETVINFIDKLPSSSGDAPSKDNNPPPIPKPSTGTVTSYLIQGETVPLFYETSTTTTSSEMTISESQTTTYYPDLVPEPPPEICYTPKIPEESSKKSHVSEKVKQLEEQQRRMSNPEIPGSVRILPPEPSPPTPRDTPKFLRKTAPTPPPKPKSVSVTPEPTLPDPLQNLEPFPFKPEDGASLPKAKPPPPPKPKKFVPGEFRESDYESDFEGKIPPKWQPTSAFATVAPQIPPSITPAFVPLQSAVPPQQAPTTVQSSAPAPTAVPPVISTTSVDEVDLASRESVKNIIKCWPPPEPQEFIEEKITTSSSTNEEVLELKRRSVKDDVNFFEGQGHSRLSGIVTSQGKIPPSEEAVSMEKLWSRPLSKPWPPKAPSPSPSVTPVPPTVPPPSSSASSVMNEPINYYISTVSTPRSTPIHLDDVYQQTTSMTTHTQSSSSYQYEEQTLQVSDNDLHRTPSPTVITDRGIKPSDAKKGWPPFSPPLSTPFKQLQPGWMKPKEKPSTPSFTSPIPPEEPPILLKPGSPPEIGFAPLPTSSQVNSQSVYTASSSSSTFESNKTVEEGTGLPGNPVQLQHTGTIYHIIQDLQFDCPLPSTSPINVPQPQQRSLQTQESRFYRDVPASQQQHFHPQNSEMRFYAGSTTNQRQLLSGSGSQKMQTTFESTSSTSTSMTHALGAKKVPRYVPSKFVKGDFYESDYASDIEETRIKPKWTPAPVESDTDSEPVYRSVRPQFKWNKKVNKAASDALESLGQSFAEKAGSVAEKFSQDLVHPTAYSHEQRNIQKGESQDPGLIYFKYDFGYEFGVVMPKETEPLEGVNSASRVNDSIALPILHETTAKK